MNNDTAHNLLDHLIVSVYIINSFYETRWTHHLYKYIYMCAYCLLQTLIIFAYRFMLFVILDIKVCTELCLLKILPCLYEHS